MPPGSFTEQIDAIQVLLVAFFLFFGVLIIYLRREDKREGYPLVARGPQRHPIVGWPAPPPPKTYRLMGGGTAQMPHNYIEPIITTSSEGTPWRPDRDPVLAGLGAAAFTERSEIPMRTLDGEPLLLPLRDARDWEIFSDDVDPRGMRVLDTNSAPIGTVIDLWVDRAAKILRYVEVTREAGPSMLVPIYFCDIDERRRKIRVVGLKPDRVASVPQLAKPDIMTPREEDRINAFFAGGQIY